MHKDEELQVRMILRANKILRENIIIKKGHGMVIFLYINEVTYYSLQPSNACAQHKKRPSVI